MSYESLLYRDEMGTRSTIARKVPGTEQYESVYCHWDGYLDNNGKLLDAHYRDPAKVAELISLGDLSSLRENIGVLAHSFDKPPDNLQDCTFYHRDRNEQWENVKPKLCTFGELLELARNQAAEYLYVFGGGDINTELLATLCETMDFTAAIKEWDALAIDAWQVYVFYDDNPKFKSLREALVESRKDE